MVFLQFDVEKWKEGGKIRLPVKFGKNPTRLTGGQRAAGTVVDGAGKVLRH